MFDIQDYIKYIQNDNFFEILKIDRLEFLNYLKTMNINELRNLQSLFRFCSSNERIETHRFKLRRVKSKEYMNITVRYPKGMFKFNIVINLDIQQFIGIYEFGLYKCDLDLEQLYQKAINP